MLKRKFTGITAATIIAVAAVTMSDVGAQGQGQGNVDGVTVPIVGTVLSGGTFAGELDIQRFVTRGDEIFALGTVTGTLTNALLGTRNVIAEVAIPLNLGESGPIDVGPTPGLCEILSLVLGPLDLDLLGLQVHLDQVVLDIDAQSGPGNLLGNLLCAVAGLLDGGGALDQIVALLNQILGALG